MFQLRRFMNMEIAQAFAISAAITSLLVSFVMYFSILFEKRKGISRQDRIEERYEMILRELWQYKESDYEQKISNNSKGFSDGYDELRYLLKEVRAMRNDFRHELNAPISINADLITAQISNAVQQTLSNHIQAEELAKLILTELTNQMSFDHFYELKEDHYRSKIHDTSRTLLNVLHVLRTPLSGVKINIQSLKKLNNPYNPELDKKYTQIEDAVNLIESNMRTLGAYEDASTDISDLKCNIQRDISLLLLTSDKRIVLNTDAIPDGLNFSRDIIDNVLICISCIVENAIIYSPDNSEIKIETTIDKGFCKLTITNFGANISNDIGNKIFEDGFTSRQDGHGIGLHLAKTIVQEKLSGTISFENISEPIGVKFHLIFEVAQ